jgi:hypothetical protein
MCPPPANNKFIGVADYLMESIHDLLASYSESIFDSGSSGGSHHPSHECFMVDIANDAICEGTPKGAV